MCGIERYNLGTNVQILMTIFLKACGLMIAKKKCINNSFYNF